MNPDVPSSLIDAMLERRSVGTLVEPGPTDTELEMILMAATTVPDHGSLRPWRFVVVSGAEREQLGAALRAEGEARDVSIPSAASEKLYRKAFVAPTFVVLISSPKPGKVARWEQEASASSAGYAMALAAHVLGIGAIWKSAPMRTGAALAEVFELVADEQLMGWVNLGTVGAEPRERRRPAELAQVASRLRGGELVRWQTATGS